MNVSYYYHHLHNIDWEIAPQLQRLMGLNKLRPQSKKAKTRKITKLTHLHSILELFHIRISIGCMDFIIIIHCFLESCVGNNLDLVYTCSRSTCKINTQLRWNPFWIGRKKSSRKMQFEWRQNISMRLRSALFSSFLPLFGMGGYDRTLCTIYHCILILKSLTIFIGALIFIYKKKRFSRVTFSSLDFQVLAKHSTNGAHKRKKL